MSAFAHLSERRADAGPDEPDPTAEVARQAAALLGDDTAYRHHTEDSLQAIAREGEVSFVPHAEGIEFNPPSRVFRWTESVHREEFRARAGATLVGRVSHGRMLVYHGVILIAELGMAFKVGQEAATGAPVGQSARPYRRIFASCSHRDAAIVAQYAQYARAVGDRYLQDVVDLRSGEQWLPALETLVREADVFQLFWSWNALESPYVRHEWQYALGLRRVSFVRPVYSNPEAGDHEVKSGRLLRNRLVG